MSCEIRTWEAHTHEKDGKTTLHVTGEGECTSSGHSLRLVRANEGTVDDPDLIVLALEVDEGDAGAEAATPEKVEGFFSIGGDPATKVEVRGAASATFPIE
ncbi:MAG: hypothetical protein M3M99_03150 [Actinomycetota bacterium]|nr:hypothetical protein [Actinomycetota bacterium]